MSRVWVRHLLFGGRCPESFEGGERLRWTEAFSDNGKAKNQRQEETRFVLRCFHCLVALMSCLSGNMAHVVISGTSEQTEAPKEVEDKIEIESEDKGETKIEDKSDKSDNKDENKTVNKAAAAHLTGNKALWRHKMKARLIIRNLSFKVKYASESTLMNTVASLPV